MIQLQVKAKSGLHAGAVWNLSKSYITVGGSSRADIFLADPGMPDSLVTLSRYGRRYVIEKLDTSAKLITPPDQKVERTIYPSQTVTIDYQNILLEFSLMTISHGFGSRLGDGFQRFSQNILKSLQSIGAKAIIKMLLGIGAVITVVVVFFGHKGLAKIEDNSVAKKKPAVEQTEEGNEEGKAATTPSPEATPTTDTPVTAPSTEEKTSTTLEETRPSVSSNPKDMPLPQSIPPVE